MKAEHRKELQTNTLADMLGKTVRKVRTTSGVPWWRVLIVALVLGGVFVFWWLNFNKRRANSELWVDLDANTLAALVRVSNDEYKDTNQNKAARFDIAFEFMWNRGIKLLGVNPHAAEQSIMQGIMQYETLAKECKGDPVWEPEALYGMAVGNEAMACFEEKQLDEALKLYQDLAKGDYAKSAYGQLAQKRADQLSDNTERGRIGRFYREFGPNVKALEPKLPNPK